MWNTALSATDVQSMFTQPEQPPANQTGPAGGQPQGPGTGPTAGAGTGGQGSAPTGGSGNHTGGAPRVSPAISGLKISPNTFTLTLHRSHALRRPSTGTTIAYADTTPARSTFTVLAREGGTFRHRRCTGLKQGVDRHKATCFRYVVVARFVRTDRAGRNSFRFTGIPGVRLARGMYRLDVTPTVNGRAGRTVSALFTIARI